MIPAAVPHRLARVTSENPLPAEWITLIGAEDVLRDNTLGGCLGALGLAVIAARLPSVSWFLIMFRSHDRLYGRLLMSSPWAEADR